MAQINSIKRVEIFPSNRASSSNTWSYRDGNPTLVFDFGVQDAYLMSATLRLNFTLKVLTTAGVVPNNDDQTGAGAVECRQNDKIGAMAVCQSLTISNALNQNLEYVRNFPRLLASLIPLGASFDDYGTYLQQYFGATSNKEAQGMFNNSADTQVSAPLLCGMFLNGDAIPLGMNGTGGLSIKLNLAPSIESNFGANAAGSYYQIINPSITVALGMPMGGALPKINNLPYNSFSSFYGLLNSSDETHNINVSLSRVISVFSNFVPTEHIANSVEDGNQTSTLLNKAGGVYNVYAPIERYTMLRGGVQYPYRFAVDENENIVLNVAGNYNDTVYTAQRQRNFMSSIKSLDRTLSTLAGTTSEATQANQYVGGIADQHENSVGENVTGVGGRMDMLSNGAGADYKSRSFSHRIQSKLDGNSANSVYSFFLHKNNISFNDRGAIAVSN
jgi:hypothetical protein